MILREIEPAASKNFIWSDKMSTVEAVTNKQNDRLLAFATVVLRGMIHADRANSADIAYGSCALLIFQNMQVPCYEKF